MTERTPLIASNASSLSQSSIHGDTEVSQPGHCATLLSEFRCRNLLLKHSREDVFYSCQWDWPPAVFVIYRLAVAVYAFVILIMNIVYFDARKWNNLPWPVWLTHWSFFLLTAHLMLAAAITVLYTAEHGRWFQRWSLRSSVYSFLPDTELDAVTSAIPPSSLPWYIQLDWLLYNVASLAAIIVTVMFFGALYPMIHPNGGVLGWSDGTMHLSNSLLALLDVMLCAVPIRLLHGFYVFLYGLTYTLFSVIYWAVDHTHTMYPHVLDWNEPLSSTLVVLFIGLIAVPLLQLAFFGIYRLRLMIYKAIYGNTSPY